MVKHGHPLAHGRTLDIGGRDGDQQLTIHRDDGVMELSVRITPEGPVLELMGTRIEFSAQTVAIQCERFEVDAGHTTLRSSGPTEIHSGEDLRATAPTIWLN